MADITDQSTVEDVIRQVVGNRLAGTKIVSVRAVKSTDDEGNPVLEIVVVFEAKSDLDATKIAGMVRHLRPKLTAVGESSFPLMSFISKKDARKLGFEAA